MPDSNRYYEFHISRKARNSFGFAETFFSITGDVVFFDSRAAQAFAAAINEKRKHQRKRSRGEGEKSRAQISASEINAMGLYHEVLHFVIASYVSHVNPTAFPKLEERLKTHVGEDALSVSEVGFVDLFPPTSVYKNEESAIDFIHRSSGDISGRHTILEELLLLWLENQNPALDPIADLVNDSDLRRKTAYTKIITEADSYFDTQPGYGPANSSLMKMLLAPIEASPDSIGGQLQFMAANWKSILVESPYLMRLLRAIDFIREEGKYFLMLAQAEAEKAKRPSVRWPGFDGFGQRGPVPVMEFRGTGSESESENFSQDLTWMPRLVLIAKNAFVWLDQLSKKYRRSISRLDQIPDDELETLSRRGFTGLWLIGIWIRSAASQKIKHLNGSWDAIASAYSLHSYDIADELGGEYAYKNLRDRAGRYGIRLASDMVPNHMGIDSTWVIQHPDWFLQADHPPYPNYSFGGPDLSGDERVGIFIEDGYWSKRDAAVVFKRLDRWTGDARYIYHGNDGTHMPWNDTAQLDFTKPEVREAVIQTILHVARMFPIIRFDAAMVLSKKHYQRLWFPEPGTGGAIPSRSEFSKTKEEFDRAIPVEFWREVVDRVQKEAPETLLLAEAFWLMEGYFVRTLGMHRVYNSAFMNMLKREENANYRQVMKNVLEYNPQILKRFVNFVNNPDEDTAIAQFGKDDKYFGVCVMMATMPGLPMFGHGQVEGLTEKYGMEFRRAYREERPDENLVARHEREIFPLLRLRHHFSEVGLFQLYDFFTGDGTVNEDVFAYSNGTGNDRNLVVYNNRFTHVSGWIKTSVGFLQDAGGVVQKTLADGLNLSTGRNSYAIFRDVISGVEYIRSVKSLRKDGLFVDLGAYKYNVFMGLREVRATKDMPYDELCNFLNGRGVSSVEEALLDFKLRDVHAAFYEAIEPGSLRYLIDVVADRKAKRERTRAFSQKVGKFIAAVEQYRANKGKSHVGEAPEPSEYDALLSVQHVVRAGASASFVSKILAPPRDNTLGGWREMLLWLFMKEVAADFSRDASGPVNLFEELRLSSHVKNCFGEMGVKPERSDYEMQLVGTLLDMAGSAQSAHGSPASVFIDSLEREAVRAFLAVHYYDGVRWFNKERFEDLLGYFILAQTIGQIAGKPGGGVEKISDWIDRAVKDAIALRKAAAKCGYMFDEFLKEA